MTLLPVTAEPLNIVFVGPPGAGKGTQAEMLEHQLHLPHISTGSLLRSNVKQGTELGQRARSYMVRGELVPDKLIEDMIRERLRSEKNGFILDGYPRNVNQAKTLETMLKGLGLRLDTVMALEVPEDELTKRLLKRGRKDDTPEVVKRRLEIYRKDTAPVLKYYESRSQLKRVSGLGSFEEVNQRVLQALGK